MKRCPQCRRNYYDDTLLYCLDDGSSLLDGPAGTHSTSPARSDDPTTAVMHSTDQPDGAQTSYRAHSTSRPDFVNTIAVLPFADLSRIKDSEYLSDGLAEELLNVLAKINGLRVAARTSAFAFKGKQSGIEEIGRALHVASVVEGSVRMAGDRVRIAVKLVDVQTGFQLWSETYDRTMNDIFAIQDDIAQSVVAELRERLIGRSDSLDENVAGEVAAAVKGRATDPEAQRLMLLGRYLQNRSNEADVKLAVQYFHQALDIDPEYALCWAELGRALVAASSHGWTSVDTNYKKAEHALRRALEFEPDLAEAHARLAICQWYRDADFVQAGRTADRALALAPESIDVLITGAIVARGLGRFEVALERCAVARAVDPLSPTAWAATAITNFFAGRFDEAEPAARRALEIAPEWVNLRAYLALILLGQGRLDQALAEAAREPDDGPWQPWALAIIYQTAGRAADSARELARLLAEFAADSAFQIAEVHAARGEISEAFTWLQKAIDHRDPGRSTAKVSPFLTGLHDDPRWLPTLRKIGFPD